MREFFETFCWSVRDFFRHWIYPAYYLKNLLFNRYDLIRLPGIRKYEYSDCVERMFLANMELVKEFIEKEKPEKHVCWYGNDPIAGPTWISTDHPLFPATEFEGMYILDLVKKIYKWYTIELPELERQSKNALEDWDRDRDGFPNLAAASLELHDKLELQIYNDKQKYMHLAIELRPYMWT